MDNFLAEIRIFGFNFPPKGWALCNGQLMSISQNTALFSLLGTMYGGDGRVTFGLPNLQASVAISQGQSPGTSVYYPGEAGGEPYVTLTSGEMPAHNHSLNVSTRTANNHQPGGQMPAVGAGIGLYNTVQQPTTTLDPVNAIALAGGGQPHNNMMPYLTLNFCIALQGIYPPRGTGAERAVLAVPEVGADVEVREAPAEGEVPPRDPTHIVFGPDDAYAESESEDG